MYMFRRRGIFFVFVCSVTQDYAGDQKNPKKKTCERVNRSLTVGRVFLLPVRRLRGVMPALCPTYFLNVELIESPFKKFEG